MIRYCGYRSCELRIQFILLVMSQGINAVKNTGNNIVNVILSHIISCNDHSAYCNSRCVFLHIISICRNHVLAVVRRGLDQLLDVRVIQLNKIYVTGSSQGSYSGGRCTCGDECCIDLAIF